MSNPYFTFSPRFIPGTKVRAQAVNTQFDLLEDAFDLLPASGAAIVLGTATLGVESGSGNAYVVTMPNTRLANASGDEVVFKAAHSNTGASTLQVDAITAAPLVRWDGTALQNGDILTNSYYVARYDSTNIRFLIVAPAQSTIVGALTYATPTGKAKLAASAGVAATVIRSDADIAIDQTIVPTWSGQHTFSQPVLGAAGTALLPAWSFSGDPNTGAYNVGADDWGVATGGTLRFDISTTLITSTLPNVGAAGSNTAPTWSFSGDPNTGAYSVGADDWGVATNGVLRFDISTTAITSTLPNRTADGAIGAPAWSFSSETTMGIYRRVAGNITFGVSSTRIAEISSTGLDLVPTTAQLSVPDGTAAAPSLTFRNDLDTGFLRPGANAVDLSLAGAVAVQFRTGGVYAVDGTITAPSWSFINDSDTGLNRQGVNDMRIIAGGVVMASVTSAGFEVRGDDGLVSAPGMRFLNDPDTGIYRRTTNAVSFAAGGTLSFEVQPSQAFCADGTAPLPGLSFFNDPDTGIYRLTGNTLAFAANGAYAGQVDTQGVCSVVGSSGAPGFSFNGDRDTGMYQVGANIVAMVAGGTEFFRGSAASGALISDGGQFIGFSVFTTTTVGPAGGASALPTTPTGYVRFVLNGTSRLIPYYSQ